MAGFAQSFEKSYNISSQKSSDATLEAIKEKIKLNEEARQSGAVLDSIEAKIVEHATKSGKTPEEIAAVSKSMDAVRKAKLSATESISLGKMLAPEVFADPNLTAQRESTTAINNLTGAFMQQAAQAGGIAIPGQTQPTQAPTATTPSTTPSPTSGGNSPIVTKLPLGRGGEMVLPEGMAQANELEALATGRGTGQAAIETEQKKLSIKLGGLGKKLNTLRNQYDEAFKDSGANPEWKQRIIGPISVIGAKTGVKPNPKLLAIAKNKRLQGIQIIKMAGESGNLAEQEQAGAIDAITSDNMTPDERKATVKQFMEVALSGAPDYAINDLLKNDMFVSVLDEVGFDYKIAGIQKPGANGFDADKEARYQAWKKSQGK